MGTWEQNQDWKELPNIEVGDIVQLKLVDVFDYLVKASVTGVKDSRIIANVQMLADYRTSLHLTGGKKMRLIGKEISCRKEFVQQVIKGTGN